MIEFRVTHADGTVEKRVVEGEQLTLGRSEFADVTVTRAPELADLHLLIAPRRGGFWASPARDVAVRPAVAGQELGNEMLAWGTEIDIGSISVSVHRVVARRAGLGGARSPLPLVAALMALATVAALFPESKDGAPTTSAEPPSLFALSESTSCPEPDRALKRGTAALAEADNKSARYAFDPADGIEAVILYELAGHCFELEQSASQAASAKARADRLRGRIEEDYKTRQVLLERAKEALNYEDLLRESRSLQAYVRHVPSDYRDWLMRLERYAEARVEGQKKGKS